MSNKKQIPRTEWQERLQMFSSGNAGRKASVIAEGMTIFENTKFRDIEYDPVGKGNDLVITVIGTEPYRHIVKAPVEIFLIEEANGKVSSLEIVDQNNMLTFIRLL